MRYSILILALLLSAYGGSDDASSDQEIVLDEPASEGGEDTSAEDTSLVVGEDACETDADCVPAGCCHAAACVAEANAPSCGDVMCSTDCQFGTLDCGGACLCHEGRCAARLSEAPEMRVAE